MKGWGAYLAYITKEDKEPLVWGEFSREKILGDSRKKRKKETTPTKVYLDELSKCKEWHDIYESEILRKQVFRSHANLRNIYEAVKDWSFKKEKRSLGAVIFDYLYDHQWPDEYSPEEIQEKDILLDWIACQICFQRPIKTKLLFLYGPPSTQKTLIFSMLSKVLRIDFVSSRRNDFTGADNFYDLWVFDEFHEPEEENPYGSNPTETAYANTLLKVLDGQECRLDSKYSRVFNKKRNVPIVMIANLLPRKLLREGAFQERFMRLPFSTQIDDIQEERIIATLWGCIRRRLSRNWLLQQLNETPNIPIKYNRTIAKIIDVEPDNSTPPHRKVIITSEKEMMKTIDCTLNVDYRKRRTACDFLEAELIARGINYRCLTTRSFLWINQNRISIKIKIEYFLSLGKADIQTSQTSPFIEKKNQSCKTTFLGPYISFIKKTAGRSIQFSKEDIKQSVLNSVVPSWKNSQASTMSLPIKEACKNRKKIPRLYGLRCFADPSCPIALSGPFRDNIRGFLQECAGL